MTQFSKTVLRTLSYNVHVVFYFLLEVDRRNKFRKKRTQSEDRDSKPQSAILNARPRSRDTAAGGDGTELSRESRSRDAESDDEGTISAAVSPTKMRVSYDGMVAKELTGLEDTPASVSIRVAHLKRDFSTLFLIT